jgi:hypothetical protein
VAAIQAEQRLLGTSPGASLPLFFHFFFFCFQPLPQDGVMNTAEVRGWLCKVQQILQTLVCLLT